MEIWLEWEEQSWDRPVPGNDEELPSTQAICHKQPQAAVAERTAGESPQAFAYEEQSTVSSSTRCASTRAPRSASGARDESILPAYVAGRKPIAAGLKPLSVS